MKELNLHKMSEDELFKHIAKIGDRIGYAQRYHQSASLMNQLVGMQNAAMMEMNDRIERINMKQILERTPEVLEISEKKQEKKENKNSRAKTKSDIIGRLRRTATPTNLKDA